MMTLKNSLTNGLVGLTGIAAGLVVGTTVLVVTGSPLVAALGLLGSAVWVMARLS